MFVYTACSDKDTYRLEKVDLVKRSADAAGKDYQFAEFTGNNFIKYNIVNLGDLE